MIGGHRRISSELRRKLLTGIDIGTKLFSPTDDNVYSDIFSEIHTILCINSYAYFFFNKFEYEIESKCIGKSKAIHV